MRYTGIISILVALLVVAAACGNGEEAPDAPDAVADDDVRTIEIIGTDDMKYRVASEAEGLVTSDQIGDEFVLESILVEPGEEIRIILTTRSEMPGTAMAHNFALLNLGVDTDQFVRESQTAADNEYIAPGLEDQVYITTAMLAGGESETLQFNAPDETGEYDFVCTFPGHFVSGMVGTMIVE